MKEKYNVIFSKYKGDEVGPTYEITFTRSIENSQRLFVGLPVGLNLYEKYENSKGIKRWILGKIINYFK